MRTGNKLIVALDVSPDDALPLVKDLNGVVSIFKIGSQLFTLMGPKIVEEILSTGAEVFLDLKFHDIPHQVAGAAASATGLGVSMFTIHASGGREMMRRAVESVKETAARKQLKAPAVIAVSVLTSNTSMLIDRTHNTPANSSAARDDIFPVGSGRRLVRDICESMRSSST